MTLANVTSRESGERLAAARVEGLTKVYGSGETRVVALDDVTVDLYAAEFTAIMGKSGSGKSTLMHCAAGLDSATSGHVYLGDVDLTTLGERHLTELRRDRIGFVFQAFNLIPTLTAEENIALPAAIAGRRPDPAWFDEVVDTVGLRDRLGHRPSELSGGQQQRVACARALVGRPEVVFADEPTGNLDSTSGGEVLGFLRRVVDSHGQTVVMVTHDPGAASYTDRVVFLEDGRVVDELREPTTERVLDRDGATRTARRGLSGAASHLAQRHRAQAAPLPQRVRRDPRRGVRRRVVHLHRHPGPGVHRADERRRGRCHRPARGLRRRGGWGGGSSTRTVPATLARDLSRCPGAARADGRITNFGTFVVGADGKLIGGQGPAGIAVNYSEGRRRTASPPRPWSAGGGPRGPVRCVVDEVTADKAGYLIGEKVRSSRRATGLGSPRRSSERPASAGPPSSGRASSCSTAPRRRTSSSRAKTPTPRSG